MNNENPQPDTPSSGYPNQSPPHTGGRRIIQSTNAYRNVGNPVSPAEPAQTSPAQTTQSDPPESAAPQPYTPQPGSPTVDSVYPNTTSGRTAFSHPNPVQARPTSNKATTITSSVKALGIIMVVLSALSLVSWLSIGLKSATEVLGIILAAGELILGVGILIRHNLARSVYVIFAGILLVFSVFGTFSYIHQQNKYNDLQNSSIIGLQSAIQHYQSDNNISAAQRAKYIQVLQKSETVERKQYTPQIKLPAIIVEYVIALLPIVFLTRPSVKKVFS